MLTDDVDLTDEQDEINNYFARFVKPKDFMSDYNDEIRFEKAFELNCILLNEYANKPVKELTTKEYFSLLSYRNDQIKKSNGR